MLKESDFSSKLRLGLLQSTEATLQSKAEELVKDVDIISIQRQLKNHGLLRINPYSNDVLALVEDKSISDRFKQELSDYEKSWATIDYTSAGVNHRDRVFRILKKHPLVQREQDVFAVPLVVMMDIANQSDVGIYTQTDASVTPLENLDTAFTTLAHNEYWRKMMGKHAVRMAKRFAQQRKRMDLVMVGDGSGELGASMANAMLAGGYDFRIVHLDIGEGMLAEQKRTYLQSGLPPNRIIGLKGSVIKDLNKIKEALPDFEGGYFVLHEILDALRTHSLISDYYGISELYQIINLPPGKQDKEAFEPTHPLVQNVGQYLPFYSPSAGQTRLMPFSPEGIICLRELLNLGDSAAIYLGDYGGQFIIGEGTSDVYQKLPIRVYGKGVSNQNDYLQLLDRTVDMTADVLPSIVYFSKLYGGTVEKLSTQEEFLTDVDPGLPMRIEGEIQRIKNRAQTRNYKVTDVIQLLQDNLFISEICNPCFFAAQITKGI